MREYIYYIDGDEYNTLVRDGIHGVEQLYQENPTWRMAAEYYWREICLGQGFNCLWEISLDEAREYLTQWGLDPELAQAFPSPVSESVKKQESYSDF
ncbi:MAG: hypothetical protein J6V25_07250 [Oscillospiraceae bacterium]|nr:hypothetical protein [Oscillospiraceae bacterium]